MTTRTGRRATAAASFALAGLLAFLAPALSGCETTEGLGEDIETLGESIDEEAEEAG